ncbi:MAG: filamentous hemagglutinin family protein, partial [Opitutus sp.]|nr:filamentous hemagglutinin family protein [Opitutus sp.]
MSRSLPMPSTARFVLTSITAAAVFYAPTTAFAGSSGGTRAAVQHYIAIQGSAGAATGTEAGTAASSAGSQAGVLATQARSSVARYLEQRQSMQALQSAARAAAQAAASNVPNGLGAGGLLVAPGATVGSALWTGAQLPTQQVAVGLTTVTVEQNDAKAMLTWQNFNIGRETKLRFNQGGGDWIAFNQIVDPSANPTRILGSIEAPGQVYVINPNGVIFHGTAQVNTRTLVASSLPLNTSLVARGVTNNPDGQFLFSGLAAPAGAQTNAFTPPAPLAANNRYGDVLVEAGAILNSPTSADKSGGRVALIGPNVTHAGSISTPDGQTIIAAGLQVGLEASADASLRGLLPSVGSVGDYAGTVLNTGQIDAPRGAVTVIGKNINQSGLIGSTTSVSRNGRIDLLAQYDAVPVGDFAALPDFFASSTGLVTLGAGSSTSILPETSSSEKAVGAALGIGSQINLRGLALHMESDASVFAPSAAVNFDAGRWKPGHIGLGSAQAKALFVYPDGQIYLDSGASINVAGSTGVTASVADNIIEAKLMGSELADSPLQRLGSLKGETIRFDVLQTGTFNGVNWVGTPLADVSEYVNNIQRTVGQLTTGGGTVNFTAGDSVVVRSGASIDVSGGYIDYAGAKVETTKVIYKGRYVDIAQATPDLVYEGIYNGVFTPVTNTAKWGEAAATSQQSRSRLFTERFEPGYIQGGDAGTLNIQAASVALDGTLTGKSVSGVRQRTTPAQSGGFSLSFQNQVANAEATNGFLAQTPRPPALTFTKAAGAGAPPAFSIDATGLPADIGTERMSSVVLSPELVSKSGFGRITVDNRDGNVVVAADGGLALPAGGQLTLTGKNVLVLADLSAPGGKIALTANGVSHDESNTSDLLGTAPVLGENRGLLHVASGVTVSAAGVIQNDAVGSAEDPLVTKGGTVTLTGFGLDLESGSTLDVSGGVYATSGARLAYGNGGTLSLFSGRDATEPTVLGGYLNLGATLKGFSGAKGGSLVLMAPALHIGGGTAASNATVLDPEFFQTGGFTSFDLRGIGGVADAALDQYTSAVRVSAGTVIAPRASSYFVQADANSTERLGFGVGLLDVGQRSPTSLSLTALGSRDAFNLHPIRGDLAVRGDLVVEAGASITTDPAAKISLSGDTVYLQGSLVARGGVISLKAGSDSNKLFPVTNDLQPQTTLFVDSGARIDASGVTVRQPDSSGRGLRLGKVLAGGTVSLTGNIAAAPGAVIDVSGASDTLDLNPVFSGRASRLGGFSTTPTQVDSAGGTLTLSGGQLLITEATLRGASGGASAEGGKLVVGSGIYRSPLDTNAVTPDEVSLIVTQSTPAEDDYDTGRGNFAVDDFTAGGFDSLYLRGVVRFDGPVSISAARELSVASGGVLYGDAAVVLSAARVSLGTDLVKPKLAEQDELRAFNLNNDPYDVAPVFGTGRLTINASQLIDVGNLSLQSFGVAELLAPKGDIRGSGTLDVAGSLNLTAAQIYPPTASVFSLHAYNYAGGTGSITVSAGATAPALPLSAGGTLNLHANTINQNGVLRVPLGVINLGWNGTGTAPVDLMTGQAVPVASQVSLGAGSETSVSAIDARTGQAVIVPYGAYANGISWVDPQGRDVSTLGPVAKQVNLSAATVSSAAGAQVDLNGGGDLQVANFKKGNGGHTDHLASTGSFALMPSYKAEFAPFAAYNDSTFGQALLGSDMGYVNSTLALGDRIYLDGGSGLAAGSYTLLPARYATLPGAFLVTPKSGSPFATAAVQPDQSVLVSGFRFNSNGTTSSATPLRSLFEVAASDVVAKRAFYNTALGSEFFKASAARNSASVPRLSLDAGQLVFSATLAMNLQGSITALAATGGRGGQVDINSPVDIRIGGASTSALPGELLLDASRLSAFSGASLLVGGKRETTAKGTQIEVATGVITVDNAGTPLAGAEIILAAKNNLTVGAGAVIRQEGTLGAAGAQDLVLGDAAVVGSGDGALVRVTSDSQAGVTRAGVSAASTASLVIAAGASLDGGAGLTLDTTGTNQIDSTAGLRAEALALSSGRISLQLDEPGTLAANPGLVLTSGVLDGLQVSSNRLALLSYSSIDIYGTGRVGSDTFSQLTLRAPALRGFNNGGGTATFQAQSIQLDGGAGGTAPAAVAADSGTLVFDARSLRLDAGQMNVSQFGQLTLSASDRLLMAGQGGLTATGSVTVETPLITAETAAVQQLNAGGRLTLANPTSGVASTPASGLGAKLSFTGGTGVTVDTAIKLPSGALALQATTGDLVIGESGAARLDVGGTSLSLLNTLHYTDAGSIRLGAGSGDVRIGSQGIIAVSAAAAAGDAGSIEVSAANGRFTSTGSLLGAAGAKGLGGRFSDDVGSLAGGSLAALDQILNAGGFDVSRTHRIRTGDVELDGLAVARSYKVIADTGALTVTGTVDASGKTGGLINLSANGDLTVANGALLDVSAETFDSAGKGGSIKLAAGSSQAGVANTAASLTLAAGATLDLSVDASNELTDAGLGRATGALHLRAPRTLAGTDLAVNPLAATIVDASRVTLEGFKVRDLTPGSGTSATITSTVRTSVLAEATTFGDATAAILARVSGTAEAGTVHVLPGIEIVNRTGDLTLDGIWDLSTSRFGPATSFAQREPGVLTLRAQGNISLPYVSSASASLSDGFGTGTSALTTTTALWNAPLLAAGSRSWSYNLVAGSDLGSAGLLTVLAADTASPTKGSFLLGAGAPAFATTIDTRQATNGVTQFYQVVRTGTGDIDIAARGDIELRNNLATIYTVGTQAAAMADFDVPNASYNTASTDLGARQYSTAAGYVAHYSHSGGNVGLFAQNDIFRTVAGLIDSSKQMPTSWLSRRGNVDQTTGGFSAYENSTANGPRTQRNSTSWWVDFNNFFEGVGALGGGNVNVTAGSDVVNIDAVAPTNARMPFGTPDASKLLELGGGDVEVRAGGNIDGGVYYVERGRGTLAAGGDITTNHTRTSLKVADYTSTTSTASSTWLPTTLFLGKGTFDLSAGGDLTLGNVANPFLLPGGINNSYFLKSYFSTYAADSGVDAFALTGDLTLRSRNPSIDGGSLYDWYNNVLRRNKAIPVSTLAGKNQPWLRLYETDMTEFATVATLMPGRLDAFAANGDINLVGVFNFLPSAQGGLQLTAAESLNGLQAVGYNRNTRLNEWASAVVNFSDANPALLPSVATPLSVSFAGISNSALVNTVTRTTADLSLVNAVFAESGSYTGDVYGRIQTKQNLHATHSVHALATEPVRFTAGSGDISGLTLFSAKKSEVRAGRDISDVALYLQNLATTDVSVVSAGRDLLLYNPSSQLRTLAVTAGNSLLGTSARGPVPASGNPTAGDLQIGGGGTLSVQAGRDIDFGATLPADDGISGGLKSPGDGTAVGLTSIGNARNLNLPDAGADVVIGVGVGDGSRIDRAAFDTAFLNPATAGANATRYLPVLAGLLGLTGADDATVFAAYSNFPSDVRAQVTSAMFNQVLRDAGRDHNDSSSAGFGSYDAGFAAIAALFPGTAWQGDLRLSSRVLTTSAGGDITVFAPGGGINLGNEITASQTPPGIITERGGDISLFTHNDVDIGSQRIFTLRGGDIMIWSSTGDIAAGSSSTTVQSASPTRVLIDPQTGDVKTDLAGLATGGGIGVLAAVEGVAAGDVDLIAPVGTIDAGDAGIRSLGNISIAALTVLNAANISAGGTTSGTPPAAAPAVSVGTAT